MLRNKTAVITGASRGIGRAIAIKMAKNGANIAVLYGGSQEAAEKVATEAESMGVKAVCYQCDVADDEQSKKICEQIVTDFGAVDILVNNAGITKDNLLLRMSEQDFDSVIQVNLKGAFHFMKHLARSLMKSPGGRIINIASVSGLMGNGGQANYSASKAGMIGLTKTVAKEFAPRNVTCNAIAPGFIETDMTANLPQAVKESVGVSVPLKRMGTPEEVANVAVFLASDQSSYITGEVIRVDGGLCM
ncbi:MAG TPA: beta-ketoacyl-ACP reductase [Clostridiales bacterium]|jgi:3-oxoacyl-[acyl-carrier protein] reductase|nr:beta-ketoacyl-ACP reductase [Clostridiales bacterium]HBE13781.1 beta-ketoacyl-ACP reductase [Clostridiales bacterium]